MRASLATIGAALLATACTSISEAEVEAATLYFPPTVRYLEEPRFCFTAAERARALRDYKPGGADTLFELVIDDTGDVVKSRLLRTVIRREFHDNLEEHARILRFTEDSEGGRYRAFYYPVNYRHTTEFDWFEPR